MKQGCIYLLTCTITGKQYVGQTRRHKARRKYYWGSGKIIKMMIKKYGKQNFRREILIDDITSHDMLNGHEVFFTKKHNTLYPSGYNINLGSALSEDTKQKLRDSHSPKSHTPAGRKKGVETRMKRGSYIAWNKGIKGSIKPNKTSFKKGKIGNNEEYILNSLSMGNTQAKIARELGVTPSGISQMLTRRNLKLAQEKQARH